MTLNITVGSGTPDDQLPPGTYPARLKAVEEKTITFEGKEKEVYEWAFEVETTDEAGNPADPLVITGLSSLMSGPKSKTVTFLTALLGPAAVQPGVTFTMADLVGKECFIQTDLNQSGYHKVIGATPLPTAAAPRRPSNRVAAGVAAPEAEAETEDLPF